MVVVTSSGEGTYGTDLVTSSLLSTEARTVETERGGAGAQEIAQFSEGSRPLRGPEPGSDSQPASNTFQTWTR